MVMSDTSLNVDLRSDSEVDLDLAVAHVQGEGVIAYPTETVYGLGPCRLQRGLLVYRR